MIGRLTKVLEPCYSEHNNLRVLGSKVLSRRDNVCSGKDSTVYNVDYKVNIGGIDVERHTTIELIDY